MVKWLGADQPSLVVCASGALLGGIVLAQADLWEACASLCCLALLCAAQSSGVAYEMSRGRDSGLWWLAAPSRNESMAVIVVPLWCAAHVAHGGAWTARLLTALAGAYLVSILRVADRLACTAAYPTEAAGEVFLVGLGGAAAAFGALRHGTFVEVGLCAAVALAATIAAQVAYPTTPTPPLRFGAAVLCVFLMDVTALDDQGAGIPLIQWAAVCAALAVVPAYNICVLSYVYFDVLLAPPFSAHSLDQRLRGRGDLPAPAQKRPPRASPWTDPVRYPPQPAAMVEAHEKRAAQQDRKRRVPDFGTRPAAAQPAAVGPGAAPQSFKEHIRQMRDENKMPRSRPKREGLGQRLVASRARREAAEALEASYDHRAKAAEEEPLAGAADAACLIRDGDGTGEFRIERARKPGKAMAEGYGGGVEGTAEGDGVELEDVVEIDNEGRRTKLGLKRGAVPPGLPWAKKPAPAHADAPQPQTQEEHEAVLHEKLLRRARGAGTDTPLAGGKGTAPSTGTPVGRARTAILLGMTCVLGAAWYFAAAAILRAQTGPLSPLAVLVPDAQQAAVYVLVLMCTAAGATSVAAVILLFVVALDPLAPGLPLLVAGLAAVQNVAQNWETGPLAVAAAPLVLALQAPPQGATDVAVLITLCAAAGVFFNTTDAHGGPDEGAATAAACHTRLCRVGWGGIGCASALNVWAMWNQPLGLIALAAAFAALPVLVAPAPRAVLRSLAWQLYYPSLYTLFRAVIQ